jgi:hypothetical protein
MGRLRGYLKVGAFDDRLKRDFNQDTFSNFGDPSLSWEGGFDQDWSTIWPFQDHAITASNADVDYTGKQQISAVYGMADLPLNSKLSVVGGVRFESTNLDVTNHPEAEAKWFPPGATAPVDLHPGDADVAFQQSDLLPSVGLVYEPVKELTLRTAYSQTVAPDLQELTPIIQQEYRRSGLHRQPGLGMSSSELRLRADYTPIASLFSASWFHNIKDPIEYVRASSGSYTTPELPEGPAHRLRARGPPEPRSRLAERRGMGVGVTRRSSTRR